MDGDAEDGGGGGGASHPSPRHASSTLLSDNAIAPSMVVGTMTGVSRQSSTHRMRCAGYSRLASHASGAKEHPRM